jgi:hypothetical protein
MLLVGDGQGRLLPPGTPTPGYGRALGRASSAGSPVRGGPEPGAIWGHGWGLVRSGVLVALRA